MHIVTGTVVEGKVVIDGPSLPEGTIVSVYAHDAGQVERLPADLQAELEDAIDDADRATGIPADDLFARLEHHR